MLLHADSCDHVTSFNGLALGYAPGTNSITVEAGNGRFGGNCYRVNGKLCIACDSDVVIVQGCFNNADNGFEIDFNGAINSHLFLLNAAGGGFSVYRKSGGGTAFLVNSPSGILRTTLRWLSFEVKIHATDGYVKVRSGNGTMLWDSGLMNTSNAAGNGDDIIKVVAIGPQSGGNNIRVDDIMVLDTSGPAPFNSWTKDIGMRGLNVAGDGTTQQFTPSAAVSHATLVDEADPNGDTDYVQSGTSGHRELFEIQDTLPTGVTNVLAVVGVPTWKATDGGGIAGGLTVRSGGVTADDPTDYDIDAAYATPHNMVMLVNPATGVAFTPAELREPIEIGLRVA